MTNDAPGVAKSARTPLAALWLAAAISVHSRSDEMTNSGARSRGAARRTAHVDLESREGGSAETSTSDEARSG